MSASDALLQGLVAAIREDVLREVRGELRAAVRDEIARGAATDPEWLTQPAAAKIADVTPQTIREWQRSGLIAKGRRGRVNAGELRRFLAERCRPESTGNVPDLSSERAKRLAASIRGGDR